MDYTTLPLRLIYSPRFSLKDFGIYDNHPINAPFAESMLKLDFIQGNYAERNVLRCLNDAYYITTMVLLEEDPRWRKGSYQKIVRANLSIAPDAFDLFSLSLVSAYLRALAGDLSPLQKAFSDTLYDYVSNHHLLVKYSIDEWMSPKVKLPRKEFAPRFIDKVVFNDLENDGFMWVEYTDKYNERIVRELIYGLGETGEEKFTLLFEIDKDAQEFYDRNSYYQDVVKEMLGKICDELCAKYDRHEDQVIHFDYERTNVEKKIASIRKVVGYLQESDKLDYINKEKKHRVLLYKDRNNIDEFPVDNSSTVEYLFFENLFDRPFLKGVLETPEYTLKIFNNAYYICTLILMENHPRQYFSTYLNIASEGHKDILWENHIMPTTMALVYSLLICHNLLTEEDKLMTDIFENFRDWDIKGAPEGKEDFYGQVITTLSFSNDDFSGYDKFESRSMVDLLSDKTLPDSFYAENVDFVISCMFGRGEEITALPMLKQRLDNIRIMDATIYNHAIEEIEKAYHYANLEWVKNSFLQEDSDEVGSKNTCEKELPMKESNENLIMQLADAQKTIDEQAQTINEQQAELKRLTTLNEVLTMQNARYDEENPEMDIDEETALSIKECIIFFSSIMDCNLNKEDISQMNLARLISKFTQWPKESIRPQIVDINTEREKNAKDHTAFSDGVHQAAVNVCALIENAMTGLKKNPLPYSCKQAVENIFKIYKSPERKIEPHEIAEAKKNLKKI